MLMDRTDNGAKTRAWAIGHAVDRYGSNSMPPFLAKIKVMELLIPAAGNGNALVVNDGRKECDAWSMEMETNLHCWQVMGKKWSSDGFQLNSV